MIIIDGKLVANHVKEDVKIAVKKLKEKGVEPCLATVLASDDPASATYVKMKRNACREVGIKTIDHEPKNYTNEQMIELITMLNADPKVHGILIQLPLPKNMNEFIITGTIAPNKDVDGLTPFNAGMLEYDQGMLKPCTPAGIMELLRYYNIDVKGKDVLIINRSMLVGKPLAMMMLNNDATVTICHSKTKGLEEKCRGADILVTAVGNNIFRVRKDMVKDNAVVIDVAINRVDGKLVGDVIFDEVKEKAAYITPVPGGVGPMTVAMLLKNTVLAASLNNGIEI
ncbi:MAG: bifunctional 5,10-methylenetetrahydrofolate dehydrogenase/5,10-methenyltetrahydrofolate cyclohydrolase [Candidatus Nitrosocaldaceae archaeon]